MTNPHPGLSPSALAVMADMRVFPCRPAHSQPHLLGVRRALHMNYKAEMTIAAAVGDMQARR